MCRERNCVSILKVWKAAQKNEGTSRSLGSVYSAMNNRHLLNFNAAQGRFLMIKRLISGGQTGVDRAALDVALALGIPCGGWCPKGRRSEDGVIPDRYPLTETKTERYESRTELNVRDSDGTLVLNIGVLEGGTAYTVSMAEKHNKPCLVTDLDAPADISRIVSWIVDNHICILNVAGPRGSKRPEVELQARLLLEKLFAEM